MSKIVILVCLSYFVLSWLFYGCFLWSPESPVSDYDPSCPTMEIAPRIWKIPMLSSSKTIQKTFYIKATTCPNQSLDIREISLTSKYPHLFQIIDSHCLRFGHPIEECDIIRWTSPSISTGGSSFWIGMRISNNNGTGDFLVIFTYPVNNGIDYTTKNYDINSTIHIISNAVNATKIKGGSYDLSRSEYSIKIFSE